MITKVYILKLLNILFTFYQNKKGITVKLNVYLITDEDNN